jgi:hypothetical protein
MNYIGTLNCEDRAGQIEVRRFMIREAELAFDITVRVDGDPWRVDEVAKKVGECFVASWLPGYTIGTAIAQVESASSYSCPLGPAAHP